MNIRKRVRTVERVIGARPQKTLIVMWPHANEARTRERVERAQARGWKIRVMRFALAGTAHDSHTERVPTPALPAWMPCAETSS